MMEIMSLQTQNAISAGSAVFVALVIAVFIGAIFYFFQKRNIHSTIKKMPLSEYDDEERTKTQTRFEYISKEVNKTQDDFRDLASKIMDLPHTTEVAEIQRKMQSLSEDFAILQGEISDKVDKNHLESAEKLEQTRKDILNNSINQMLQQAEHYIAENTVKKEDFVRLQSRLEKVVGGDAFGERLLILSEIFQSYNLRMLSWQCKLINLLRGGLAPNAEQDTMLANGIPKSTYMQFLDNLESIGAVEKKKEWSYYLKPEFDWLYSFTNDPTLLQRNLEPLVTKEREYQNFIRDNINLVEDSLLVDQAEYPLETGIVDFMCTDKDGRKVGIELKYPKAVMRAKWQISAYKASFIKQTGLDNCRFILVSPQIPSSIKKVLDEEGIEHREISFSSQ